MAIASCCAYLKRYGKFHHKSTPRLHNYQQVNDILPGFSTKFLLLGKYTMSNLKTTFFRENEWQLNLYFNTKRMENKMISNSL